MAWLVTGALGHVGREIVRQLVAGGKPVVAIYRDGEPEDGAPGQLVTWRRCDLDDAASVAALGREHAVSTCIHAAAVSNEAYAKPNPLAAISTNVMATAHLLEAARVHGWRRFVLVSTGGVFHRRADISSPIPEDAPFEPGSVYSSTKAAAELMTRMYRATYNLSAATVRISWVFGPPVVSLSPARGPIPSFLIRALRGEPIREGGADFRASFTWIGDVARGLIAAAEAAELRFDTYHLGHGRDFTAGEVAACVRDAVPGAVLELAPGTEPWTRYTALRGALSGDRLLQDTGFAPSTALSDAIAAYAVWLRRHPELVAGATG